MNIARLIDKERKELEVVAGSDRESLVVINFIKRYARLSIELTSFGIRF